MDQEEKADLEALRRYSKRVWDAGYRQGVQDTVRGKLIIRPVDSGKPMDCRGTQTEDPAVAGTVATNQPSS